MSFSKAYIVQNMNWTLDWTQNWTQNWTQKYIFPLMRTTTRILISAFHFTGKKPHLSLTYLFHSTYNTV